MLSLKQKEWLWQDCKKAKANGEDIPMAKKRCSHPSNKSTARLESAVTAQKRQISSLTAKNEKMIASLIASGFEIPQSDPSSDEKEGNTAKKKAAIDIPQSRINDVYQ